MKKDPKKLVLSEPDVWKQRGQDRTGKYITLPTGPIVKVRKPKLLDMFASGQIPGELINLARNKTEDELNKKIEGNPEARKKTLEMMNAVVKAAFVEPKIVDEPDYDKQEIHVDDLDMSDKLFVYKIAMGGTEELKKFREQSDLQDTGSDSKPVSGKEAK